MRYYSTYCAAMSVVRKEDYYMSVQTARRVTKKLGYVLELTPSQMEKVVVQLTRGQDDMFFERIDDRCEGFTPAELGVIRNLMSWYAYEYNGTGENPAFVACNLNAGRSLVISEGRKTRGVRSTASYLEEPQSAARPAGVIYARELKGNRLEVLIDPKLIDWE